MPTCVHCGRTFPDIETRAWGANLVCVPCYEILTAGTGADQSVPAGLPPTLGYAFPSLYPPQGNSGLGTASLVLGITCLLLAWVPICGIIAWPLCLAGLILAIIDLCQKNRPHGHSIAGLILSIVGFMAPFACIVGTAMTGSMIPSPAPASQFSPATQSSPAVPAPASPVPAPVEAPDVEK